SEALVAEARLPVGAHDAGARRAALSAGAHLVGRAHDADALRVDAEAGLGIALRALRRTLELDASARGDAPTVDAHVPRLRARRAVVDLAVAVVVHAVARIGTRLLHRLAAHFPLRARRGPERADALLAGRAGLTGARALDAADARHEVGEVGARRVERVFPAEVVLLLPHEAVEDEHVDERGGPPAVRVELPLGVVGVARAALHARDAGAAVPPAARTACRVVLRR